MKILDSEAECASILRTADKNGVILKDDVFSADYATACHWTEFCPEGGCDTCPANVYSEKEVEMNREDAIKWWTNAELVK